MKNSGYNLCICGHAKEGHTGVYDYMNTETACMRLMPYDTTITNLMTWCQCYKFQLDNLSYIEKVAKDRGLI